MDKVEQLTTQSDELLREIFLHGHSEGWTGNQTRRDVKHVDAEKGWSLYVSNGALEKTKALHRTTSLAAQDGLVAEIERQEGLAKTYRGAQLRAEEKLCREQANAQGWKRRAEMLESKLSALSAIKEQHHD